MYVCTISSPRLTVIRPQTLVLGADIPLTGWEWCFSVVVNKAGTLLYAVNNLANKLLTLNTATNPQATGAEAGTAVSTTGTHPSGTMTVTTGSLM